MHTKEKTPIFQLSHGITELVIQLQSCQKQGGKYQLFEIRLEKLLVAYKAYENDLLSDLVEWAKGSGMKNHTSPYWDYTVETLTARMKQDDSQVHENGVSLRIKNNENISVKIELTPSFVDINNELANTEKYIERIKNIRLLRPLVDFMENLESHKIRLNKVVQCVWSYVQKLLLFGLLDKLYLWLRENH